MRLTLVTETYFPQLNGVSRTLGQLVRVLTDCGDSVQVIHPDYGELLPRGLRHFVWSTRVPFYPELYMPLPPFGRARRAIDGFRPDLVHVATEATLGLSMLRHVRRRMIPVISSFHTNFDQYSAHYGAGWARGLIWRYLRWFHNQTRETYVPSKATIAALEARGFERLALWPRGVDGTLFRPDRPGRALVRQSYGFQQDDVVIAHVGRIAAEKNVMYLAEALARVAASRPRVRVLIVGDGPARPTVEQSLGPYAVFAGYRSGEDLADHYAASDSFAFASLTETFGNVVLEAMAAGLPVVALRSGGPAEILKPGATGLLVEPEEPPEVFSRALGRLVDDVSMRRAMAEEARAHALTRTWDAIMRGLRERYLSIVNERKG